ncbi:hypothetical protein SK066_02885 [Paenibacillus hunanensis]|uniref:hypothetical protein n=1 Tax=Paenibacillus hunanensis TaxID=539262 RepID=UPI002A6A3FD5|nr:hypothetical protein [Paenibacillus hunanensis]WPP41927.1 hypothetical protein SK066_02885 [Paenibacillus hunanensis]
MIKEIDGAKVIKYTPIDNFGYVEWQDGIEKEITILAICHYENKEECYLFACDEKYNVLGDTVHDSLEDAMQAALELYEKHEISWL